MDNHITTDPLVVKSVPVDRVAATTANAKISCKCLAGVISGIFPIGSDINVQNLQKQADLFTSRFACANQFAVDIIESACSYLQRVGSFEAITASDPFVHNCGQARRTIALLTTYQKLFLSKISTRLAQPKSRIVVSANIAISPSSSSSSIPAKSINALAVAVTNPSREAIKSVVRKPLSISQVVNSIADDDVQSITNAISVQDSAVSTCRKTRTKLGKEKGEQTHEVMTPIKLDPQLICSDMIKPSSVSSFGKPVMSLKRKRPDTPHEFSSLSEAKQSATVLVTDSATEPVRKRQARSRSLAATSLLVSPPAGAINQTGVFSGIQPTKVGQISETLLSRSEASGSTSLQGEKQVCELAQTKRQGNNQTIQTRPLVECPPIVPVHSRGRPRTASQVSSASCLATRSPQSCSVVPITANKGSNDVPLATNSRTRMPTLETWYNLYFDKVNRRPAIVKFSDLGQADLDHLKEVNRVCRELVTTRRTRIKKISRHLYWGFQDDLSKRPLYFRVIFEHCLEKMASTVPWEIVAYFSPEVLSEYMIGLSNKASNTIRRRTPMIWNSIHKFS